MTSDPLANAVIGLSGNVLDAAMNGGGRPDGIGIYTRALECALHVCGTHTRRIFAPAIRGNTVVRAPAGQLHFRVPIPLAVTMKAAIGVSIPGGDVVERAVDLYHATDYMVPPLRRIPVVSTIYDAVPLMRPEWASPRLRRLKNALLRHAATRADMVIAISHAMVPEIVAHFKIPDDRIRVVALGVAPEWFDRPAPDAIEATLKHYKLQPGYFLFVGTIQPRKNIETLLAAYDQLPADVRSNRQMVVVGRFGWGPESIRTELGRRTLDGRVVWLDYVDEDRLRDLYAGAGAFVYPSLAEGFGLPLLEALAAGLPLIASDLPVFREVLDVWATYAPATAAEAFAAAMVQAVEETKEAQAIAARRAHARSYDWRATAEKTRAVYAEAICQ